ncbi:MAG: 50S ribosomal protein L28 [Candidatus Acidiferrum sp.]
MKRSVLQFLRANFLAAQGSLVGRTMALKCELCGKGPHFGNVISHANNTRRRRWNPNLKRVHALVDGARKHVRVCTACIRAGRVKKAA